MTTTGPTVRSVFARIDRNGDGALERSEVKKMMEDAKVGGGLFGGTKVNMATDAFMDLDPNKDGRIELGEVTAKLQEMLGGGATEPGEITEKALEWYDAADKSGDGRLTHSEVKGTVKALLEERGESFADMKADIAAKVAVHLVDHDRNGVVDRGELENLAKDVENETNPPAEEPPAEEPTLWV